MSHQISKDQEPASRSALIAIDKNVSKQWRDCKDLIGAIDQGTSSTRFLVFECESGQLIASSQIEIKRIVPKEGWVEMDPKEIMGTVYDTIRNVHNQIATQGCIPFANTIFDKLNQLKCVGICNQRESTVVWDRITGEPFYNVIVWMDNRTKDIVDDMIDSAPGRDFNFLKDKTGLPMSTYFSAFKLKWLIDNVPQVKQAMKENRLMFGTVDSWILWNLTGQHTTDVTNASRTFLMDIETLEWDQTLCKFFGIPMKILPKIRSSADNFGVVKKGPLEGVPVTGVIGDQSAALFGHNCLHLGQTKATFGTGCFIMQNIGPGPLNGALSGVNREARRGLVTTVGYKLRDKPAYYALEGSIKIAGAALTWLRDNLQLIRDYTECDELINKTTHSSGVFFVPALGGLYSPYWDPNASGIFIGLSQFTRREHLVRATFDSIAFQTNDILNLMRGVTSGLMIDGGLCKSGNMCQILADITGCEIVRPSMTETSALGAAMVAGYGAGMWSHEKMLARSNSFGYSSSTHHYPHKALHYEDKFLSLITTSMHSSNPQNVDQSNASNDVNHKLQYNQSRSLSLNEEERCCNTGSSLCSETESHSESIDEEVEREVRYASAQDDNLVDSNRASQACAIGHVLSDYYPTPSSGYSSGDNYEVATNSACDMRRDTPFSTQITTNGQATYGEFENETDCDSKGENDSQLVGEGGGGEGEDDGDGGGGGGNQVVLKSSANKNKDQSSTCVTEAFPLNYCPESYDNNSQVEQDLIEEKKAVDIDLKDDCNPQMLAINANNNNLSECQASDLLTVSTSVEPRSSNNSIVEEENDDDDDYSDIDGNKQTAKVVDVFQSYISLEHRTELVNTWHLAVERSMKWTKVDHEEIRRIDYQRLSSLPLSIYLFFSVGIFALSGLLSGRIRNS